MAEEYVQRVLHRKFMISGSPNKIIELEENSDILRDTNKEESVVWPSMAVVANIPVEYKDDSYLDYGFLGDIAKNLKDEWIKKGYKPVKVNPLWSCLGHSGFAVVEFGKELDSYKNAKMFVKDFEVEKHGRKDWYDCNRCEDDEKLYAWIANDEDYYYSVGVVGGFLRKNGVLKAVSAIEKENENKLAILADENAEAKKKIEWIEKDLEEKEKEIEKLKELNQALIAKEKLRTDELEDTRKALITGLREIEVPPQNVISWVSMDYIVPTLIDFYDPSVGSLTKELWNKTQNRKAILKEGLRFILKQWKAEKQQKRR